MAAPKRPSPGVGPTWPAGATSPHQRIATRLKVALVVLACLVGLVAVIATSWGDDSSTVVPAPEAADRTETVTLLERAAAAQHICYGWRLTDGSVDVVSRGSNLGESVPVDSDPTRCPRWLEVVAEVTYTEESSESYDHAYLSVDGSDDLSSVGYADGLARFGIDEQAILDDPGWAVCQAALVLPLLAAEAGAAAPVPMATAVPTSTLDPLPAAGSDFWRDRWPYLAAAAGLLLVAALLLTIGWVECRHQRWRPKPIPRARGARGRPRPPAAAEAAPGGLTAGEADPLRPATGEGDPLRPAAAEAAPRGPAGGGDDHGGHE